MTSEERKVRIAVAIELMESVMLDIVREENGNGRSLTIHTALAKGVQGRRCGLHFPTTAVMGSFGM